MKTSDAVAAMNAFAPIRAVNGFVALDFVWGCYRCDFCFNRHHFHLYPHSEPTPYPLSPESAAELLLDTPLIEVGTVIKIGHNSDQSLQMEPSWKFYQQLPQNTNVAFYRRKPISSEEFQRFRQAKDNLLLVMTLTPGSKLLRVPRHSAWDALESTRGLPYCFYAIRPVAKDAVEESYALLKHLPPQSIIDICGVISSFGGESVVYDDNLSPDPATISDMRHVAFSSGFQVNCSVNCLLRGRQGLGSHWADKNFLSAERDVREFCESCPSYKRCREGLDSRALPELLEIAKKTSGLSDLRITDVGTRRVTLRTDQEVNRGDQNYLRGLFNARIKILGPSSGLADEMSAPIFQRWEHSRFFPVKPIAHLANTMAQRIHERFSRTAT